MSYLDRLKQKISEDAPEAGATKVSKGAFVPFVATPVAPLRQIPPPDISRGWLVRYADGSMVDVYFTPAATRAEALIEYPDAITAEPIPETAKRIPTAPMTANEEAAIRAWLAHIEETDPAIIADVLDKCRTDADAREYFIRRAEEVSPKMAKEIER